MSAEDVVLGSANLAVDTVGTASFAKRTRAALRRAGEEMARHATDEGLGIFAPVDVVADGRDHPGAVLALEDRVIIGWTEGTLRTRNVGTVIPTAALRRVERAVRAGGAMTGQREVLRLETERERWTLVFEDVREGDGSIVALIHGVLTGAVSPALQVDEAAE